MESRGRNILTGLTQIFSRSLVIRDQKCIQCICELVVIDNTLEYGFRQFLGLCSISGVIKAGKSSTNYVLQNFRQGRKQGEKRKEKKERKSRKEEKLVARKEY